MKMVWFTDKFESHGKVHEQPIAVNPDRVTFVKPSRENKNNKTEIYFTSGNENDGQTVDGSMADVIAKLTGQPTAN